jgi:hypothetical protein
MTDEQHHDPGQREKGAGRQPPPADEAVEPEDLEAEDTFAKGVAAGVAGTRGAPAS